MVKAVSIVLFVLMVGAVFTGITLIINDMESYNNVGIDQSLWEDQYNYSSEVNADIASVTEAIENIDKATGGWKLFLAAAVIPVAVVQGVLLIFSTLSHGTSIVTGIAIDLGIPEELIAFGIMGLVVIFVFVIIDWLRRNK